MSRCDLFIHPGAWSEIKGLPGHMRQRIKRAIDALAVHPRPHNSKRLSSAGSEHELRRLRLDRWRIVYAITEADEALDILAVRRRPPYDFGDLGALAEEVR